MTIIPRNLYLCKIRKNIKKIYSIIILMNFSNLSFSFNSKRKSYKNTNHKKNITIVDESKISNVSTKKQHQPIIIKKPKNISNKKEVK